MPVFDTPIHVNDLNWSKILQQKQPVLLYLFDQPYPELDKRLQQLAEQNAEATHHTAQYKENLRLTNATIALFCPH